jgi:hypothetical protein
LFIIDGSENLSWRHILSLLKSGFYDPINDHTRVLTSVVGGFTLTLVERFGSSCSDVGERRIRVKDRRSDVPDLKDHKSDQVDVR